MQVWRGVMICDFFFSRVELVIVRRPLLKMTQHQFNSGCYLISSLMGYQWIVHAHKIGYFTNTQIFIYIILYLIP